MVERLTTVFLDRDGVINVRAPEEAGVQYIESWDSFEFLPGALMAVRRLRATGLRVVVVTNQRGVARGRMTMADVEDIHARMRAAGLDANAVYYCPHDEGECDCRKPRTGMFERAARDVPGVSLGKAGAIVGDSESDMQAGRTLGLVLVKVGRAQSDVEYACGSLEEAAEWLLNVRTR